MRFSPFSKHSRKPPSLAFTSALPHVFPYFGRLKCVTSPFGRVLINAKSPGTPRAAAYHEPVVA